MRKVLLRFLLVICFTAGIGFSHPVSTKAVECAQFEYDKYTYEKVIIDGVIWVFVYDEAGSLMEIYPETINTGPANGGH